MRKADSRIAEMGPGLSSSLGSHFDLSPNFIYCLKPLDLATLCVFWNLSTPHFTSTRKVPPPCLVSGSCRNSGFVHSSIHPPLYPCTQSGTDSGSHPNTGEGFSHRILLCTRYPGALGLKSHFTDGKREARKEGPARGQHRNCCTSWDYV